MKIFLLEDDASIAMGLEYSLHKEGYETAHSKTVSEALAAIGKRLIYIFLI